MIIAVIPARGGSKGIKRKNLRLLEGKPLISYIIETAINSKFIDKVLVSTDDSEIKEVVSCYYDNVIIHTRNPDLAKDDISLDPVIIDAVEWYEKTFPYLVDIVITLQPTSPLLSSKTLDSAIDFFISKNLDSLISAVDNTHLCWKKVKENFYPEYEKRVNRQLLPVRYKETGSFIICKRKLLEAGTRIGDNISIYPIPKEESIDIDDKLDFYVASALFKKLQIYFVTTGNELTGLGHIYRALTLADFWLGHSINFILYNSSNEVNELIETRGYSLKIVNSLDEVSNYIHSGSIIINDVLDTDSRYIKSLKNKKAFVVNFEDLGDGSEEANLVINALYEKFNPPPNHKFGFEYECLNESFLLTPPNSFNNLVNKILITFGGTDPNNLTLLAIKALEKLRNILTIQKIDIVIGPAYRWLNDLEDYIQKSTMKDIINLHKKVNNMALVMKNVDLAITSNGRTIYELAAMKIPTISIAQNDRETMHLFSRYSKGILYLGIASNISEEEIFSAIEELIKNVDRRKYMYDNLPSKQLHLGIFRVTNLIENEFRRWNYENNHNWK